MNSFTFHTPTRVCFGTGTASLAGKLIREQGGSRVLIHYGGRSALRSGLIDQVCGSLEEAGLCFVKLGGVVPNPRLSLVYKGIDLVRRENIDFVLAVGGGSVIDSAKAICYGAVDDGDVWDFYDRRRQAAGALPLGVVLTIAASGSEMSDSSVISRDEGLLKRGYHSPYGVARFALMDPALTLTLPDYQTACGCADIMMHTMERYFVARDTMEITDSISEALLRTVVKNALILRTHPDNLKARAEIMWAGSLSHNGLTGCGNGGDDFATHAMEHELSALYDVAHGAGLAALWGSWARYVQSSCPERFYRFAVNVWSVEPGGDITAVGLRGIEATEEFFRSMGLPTSITGLGVEPDDSVLELMAKKCAAANKNGKGAARLLHEEDFLNIYRLAL